jgi:hypothetical protein
LGNVASETGIVAAEDASNSIYFPHQVRTLTSSGALNLTAVVTYRRL